MDKPLLAKTMIGKKMTILSSLETPKERGDLEEEVNKIREYSKKIGMEWKKLLSA
jgi:uncharacterized protein YlzI (FlbEa/FlbD family)